MRYALISDIHGSLPALRAVLDDIARSAQAEATYHLGYLVGYAPWPSECVALLRENGLAGIAGNYDSTVAADYEHRRCQYEDPRQEQLSRHSYGWSREHVSLDTRRYLGTLPFGRADVQVKRLEGSR